jgi:hypothetical protein
VLLSCLYLGFDISQTTVPFLFHYIFTLFSTFLGSSASAPLQCWSFRLAGKFEPLCGQSLTADQVSLGFSLRSFHHFDERILLLSGSYRSNVLVFGWFNSDGVNFFRVLEESHSEIEKEGEESPPVATGCETSCTTLIILSTMGYFPWAEWHHGRHAGRGSRTNRLNCVGSGTPSRELIVVQRLGSSQQHTVYSNSFPPFRVHRIDLDGFTRAALSPCVKRNAALGGGAPSNCFLFSQTYTRITGPSNELLSTPNGFKRRCWLFSTSLKT